MTMNHRTIPIICAALLAFTPLVAFATDPSPVSVDQKKAAQKMFEAGDALYESARYDDAVEAFRQSNTLVNSPNSRLMLARCLRELGKSKEACTEFAGTIHDAESSGGRYPETLQAATAELEALKAQTSADCAQRTTSATTPIAAPFAHAEAQSSPTPQAITATPTTNTTSVDNPLRTAAWASAGVGAAGVLGFAVFGYLNHQTYNKLDKDCPGGTCTDNSSSRIESGKRYQTIANVSLGVAVLGAAAATTLFIVSTPRSADGRQLSLQVSPSAVVVDGRF
jgi:tetratricopeptide (TPR) repeat protein